MATIFAVHPITPQVRLIEQIIQKLKAGAVLLYPTDTTYAIGCDLYAKDAIARVRQIKHLATGKPLTFLCPSLANIAHYAEVSDTAYRIMRRLVPGPYTFILPGNKLVPKLVLNPKRKTTGVRVPDHRISQALLDALGNPIISTSARIPGPVDEPATMLALDPALSRDELFDCLDRVVDVILDDGQDLRYEGSSVLDLSDNTPQLIRQGLGWEALEELIPSLVAP